MTNQEAVEHDNNLIATGAIFGLLMKHHEAVTIKVVNDAHGHSTNQIDVRFPFLRSTYRITVERKPYVQVRAT